MGRPRAQTPPPAAFSTSGVRPRGPPPEGLRFGPPPEPRGDLADIVPERRRLGVDVLLAALRERGRPPAQRAPWHHAGSPGGGGVPRRGPGARFGSASGGRARRAGTLALGLGDAGRHRLAAMESGPAEEGSGIPPGDGRPLPPLLPIEDGATRRFRVGARGASQHSVGGAAPGMRLLGGSSRKAQSGVANAPANLVEDSRRSPDCSLGFAGVGKSPYRAAGITSLRSAGLNRGSRLSR